MSTTDGLDFFLRHADVVRRVRMHCFASLTFQTWDAALTIGDEVEYIWPIPWNYKVKWWYIYFRYVTLAAHIAYGVSISYLTSVRAPESTCRAWFLFAIAIAACTKTQIELMFAMRVHILFNRRRWVIFFLCTMSAAGLISDLLGAVYTVPTMAFEEVCILVNLPREGVSYLAVSPIIQCVLVGTILSKSFLAIHAGWGRTPLVSLLIREGFVVFFVFMGGFILIVIVCSLQSITGVSVIIWSISVLSTVGCRLIINMQRIAAKHNLGGRARSDSGAIFTSEIELSVVDAESREA